MEQGSRLGLAVSYAAISVIWGATYLAIKVGLESFEPFFYAGMRYVAALAIMFPLALVAGASFSGPLRRWWPAFGIGALFVGVCNGMVFWAETRLDSGFTALLLTSGPVWTALLTPLLPGEKRLGKLGWLGIVAGFVGTMLLIEPWRAGRVEFLPSLVVEVSVVIWAATSLWVRRIRNDYHPLALTAAQMGAGAVVLLAVAAARGTPLVGPVTPRALGGLVFLVVFGSCVAFAAYFYLLRYWDATRVSTSSYVNPVVAVLLGAVVLEEKVTLMMVVGSAVVLAGVALVLREQRRPAPLVWAEGEAP